MEATTTKELAMIASDSIERFDKVMELIEEAARKGDFYLNLGDFEINKQTIILIKEQGYKIDYERLELIISWG